MDPKIASLAAIPSREKALAQTLETIYPQFDHIQVYLNGWEKVPSYLRREKVEVFRSQEEPFGDRGDAGKFYRCQEWRGYHFLCDDDMLYPADYAVHMVDKIEEYGRRLVVGNHGVVLGPVVKDYYRDRTTTRYQHELLVDTPVHILGTACAAYHTDTIRMHEDDFSIANMGDVWFGLKAQRLKIGMLSIARPAGWLRDVEAEIPTSIFTSQDTAGAQTEKINEIARWELWARRVPSRKWGKRLALGLLFSFTCSEEWMRWGKGWPVDKVECRNALSRFLFRRLDPRRAALSRYLVGGRA